MDPTYIYWNRAYKPFDHDRHQTTNELISQPKQSRLLNKRNHRFDNNNEAGGSNQPLDQSSPSTHTIVSTDQHNRQQHPLAESNNHISVSYERLEYSWFELALPITILSLSILAVLLIIAWLILWTKQKIFGRTNSISKTSQHQVDRYRIEARQDQIRMIDDDFDLNGVYHHANTSSINPLESSGISEKESSTPISPTASQTTFHYPQRQIQSPIATNAATFHHDALNSPIADNTTITSVPIHVSISVPVSTIVSQPINYSPTSNKVTDEQSPPSYRTTTIVNKPRVRKVHQKDVCTPPPPPQPMDVRKFSFIQTHQSLDSTHQAISAIDTQNSDKSTPHQSIDWNDSPTPITSLPPDSCYFQSSMEHMSPQPISTNNALVHGYRYRPIYSPKTLSDDKENAVPISSGSIGVTSSSSHSAASSPKIYQRCGEIALAQQNSPRIIDSSASSTGSRFTFSPRLLQQHSADVITTTGISPITTSAGYKHGNYFRFPEVDAFTPNNYKPMTPTTVVEDKIGIEIITSTGDDDTDGMNDDLCGVDEDEDGLLSLSSMRLNDNSHRNSNVTGSTSKTQATRRARLKSISLDSDGAKLVEENLRIPVEELVEIAAGHSEVFDKSNTDNANMNDDRRRSILNDDLTTDSDDVRNNSMADDSPTLRKSYTKNKNNLSINLNIRNDSLAGDEASDYDYKCNKIPTTPKTPTFTQHRQKAISLDSDPTMSSFESPWKTQQPLYTATSHINISSISMPTTPKRQPAREHLQSVKDAESHQNYCNHGHSTSMTPTSNSCSTSTGYLSKHQQKFKHSKRSLFAAMRQDESKNRSSNLPKAGDRCFAGYMQKLGSFHEKMGFEGQCNNERSAAMYLGEMKTSQSGDYLGSNLQALKTTTLSVSNNNLKTLPEVMTLSDFGTTSKMSTSCSTTPCSMVSGNSVGKSRNSIIQRRGSNHSLTLNAEQGLSVSNYSLGNLQGSNCNLSGTNCGAFSFETTSSISAIRNKKNLLQRRGSNTSLTLNIQGSSNSLNLWEIYRELPYIKRCFFNEK